VKVEIQFSRPLVAEAVDNARARQDTVLINALTDIGQRGEMLAKGLAPNSTGRFEDSIGFEVDRRSVRIGSSSKRAHLVEKGRGPGKMPPAALIASIFEVGKREAFTIARKIGATGTDGAFVFRLTSRQMKPIVAEIAADAGRDLGRLSND
jgi:hypothetical protein